MVNLDVIDPSTDITKLSFGQLTAFVGEVQDLVIQERHLNDSLEDILKKAPSDDIQPILVELQAQSRKRKVRLLEMARALFLARRDTLNVSD